MRKFTTGTPEEIVKDYLRLQNEYKDDITRTIYREYGIYSETLIEKIFGSFTDLKGYVKAEKKAVDKCEIDNKLECTLYSYELRTEEDIIDYANIDTDIWEVTKIVSNAWGSSTNPCYQIKVWCSKRDFSKINQSELINIFKERSEEFVEKVIPHSPKYKQFKRKAFKEGCLLEISILDLHLGQLSWSKETRGEDYNLQIAQQRMLDAVDYFIDCNNLFKINKILLPVGSDFFNSNDSSNSTYGGTLQDEDSRWQKTFMVGVDTLRMAIDKLRKVADVDVVVIYGNHDFERAFHAGAYLEAWYRNDKHVGIDNKPNIRKYYKFGENLIGLTHGHDIKPDRLFMQMPVEAKDMWVDTKYWEWHIGHLHHKNTKVLNIDTEEMSLRIKTLPSLVEKDAWHTIKGYSSIKEAVSFIWSQTEGNIAQFNFKPY